MKKLLLSVALLMSCAASQYAFHEAETCPVSMTEDQKASGRVRCAALCSSYARDFASFDDDCKCRCAPQFGGGYRPNAKPAPLAPSNQM